MFFLGLGVSGLQEHRGGCVGWGGWSQVVAEKKRTTRGLVMFFGGVSVALEGMREGGKGG